MNNSVLIRHKSKLEGTIRNLPSSKSISNRVLVIDALAGGTSILHNLSNANDTQLMMRLINSKESVIDIEDAGTTMRFLTAYFGLTGQHKTLTGTPRMQERPIGILVDALRAIGAEISYQNKEGYPPLTTKGFGSQKTNEIVIRGDVSSQFTSALMMIAPTLPLGLKIRLTGKIGSRPYIDMTSRLMKEFGAACTFADNVITIEPTHYHPTELSVESDWSAASYWFGFTALAENADIILPFLFDDSLQGDQAIQEIMVPLGVQGKKMDGEMLSLSKVNFEKEIKWDFTHCPDLAQTVAVVCAAKGITGYFTGLESLRIKETDRISALQTELQKIGADLLEGDNKWTLKPSHSLPAVATFQTYHDHRMAMAFAPLATRMNVIIESPGVVKKSYPSFWRDLEEMEFELKFQ
ncbi:MAG TPA: 3-phosphoshikimate 1-carboxyvinyltransferase [Cyclobacteriaceae bacterium]|nr:3-phosphoshikimate 1-carboxyvinyltransferase [Cyclobacteriaceae bacterium]